MKSSRQHGWKRARARLAGSFAILAAPALFAQSVIVSQQPASQQVLAGASVTLSVAAGGSVSGYQWLMNGTNLPGQTNSVLLLTQAEPANTGSYQAVVFGGLNTFPVYSAIARLEVDESSAASTPIAVSGWNENVILENSQYAGVTEFFDDVQNVWFESGFQGHANGLPVSGQLASALNTNVIFQFQPYGFNFNNALRMDELIEGAGGTLRLVRPAAYESLAMLASSAQGGGTGKVVLNFSDGTSSPQIPFAAYAWTAGNPAAIAGLGRAYFDSSTTAWDYDDSVTELAMFETDIDLAALGLDKKALTDISFVKPSAPQVTAVFAVSGEPNPSVQFPFAGAISDLTVPGTANPWLAGMPDGTASSGEDLAPYESPAKVFGLPLIPGDHLAFQAAGGVSYSSAYPLFPPNGNTSSTATHMPGVEHGISPLAAPVDSLIGVFLGPDQPNLSPNPPGLLFDTPAERDYLLLTPLLKQVFYIGGGLTSAGAPHQVIVPHGATRFFLGSMDQYSWYDNQGSFSASVTESNLLNLGVAGYAGGNISLQLNGSPGFTNLVQSAATLADSNWTTIATIVLTNSSFLFVDTNSAAASRRFYRLIQLP